MKGNNRSMLKNKVRLLVLVLPSLFLLACSTEGKNDYGSYYEKQSSLTSLKLPTAMASQEMDNYYTVPPGPMADVKTVSILPPGSLAFQLALAKEQAKTNPGKS